MQQIKQLLLKCPHDYSNILIWLVCCTAFFGFLRCSEFTAPQEHEYYPTVHLSYKDVAIDCSRDPQIIQIHIKQSNCSQAAANIQATTYYFTAKSFMHITWGGHLIQNWCMHSNTCALLAGMSTK